MPHNETCQPSEKCRITMLHQKYILRYRKKNIKYYFGANAKVIFDIVTFVFLSLYVLKVIHVFYSSRSALHVLTCLQYKIIDLC